MVDIPFLLNEDSSLRLHLQGLRVTDADSGPGGRPVTVRFRSPEDEVAKYTPPLILIEMPELAMAYDRMHEGFTKLPYAPEGYATWWPDNATSFSPDDSLYWAPFPIAYNITYKLTVFARLNRDHMMPILAALEREDKLGRFAVLNIPQDGTFRRITRLAGPERDYGKDELGKRLFRATYMIRVPTELVVVPPQPPKVTTVNTTITAGFRSNLDLSAYYTDRDITSSEVAASWGILSARKDVQWNTIRD